MLMLVAPQPKLCCCDRAPAETALVHDASKQRAKPRSSPRKRPTRRRPGAQASTAQPEPEPESEPEPEPEPETPAQKRDRERREREEERAKQMAERAAERERANAERAKANAERDRKRAEQAAERERAKAEREKKAARDKKVRDAKREMTAALSREQRTASSTWRRKLKEAEEKQGKGELADEAVLELAKKLYLLADEGFQDEAETPPSGEYEAALNQLLVALGEASAADFPPPGAGP